MSVIQGIGDEVIFFFMFMFLLIVVLIVITLRASRSRRALADSRERLGVATGRSRLGYGGAGLAFEDSSAASEGVERDLEDSRTASNVSAERAFEDSWTASGVAETASDCSRVTSDSTKKAFDYSGAASDKTGREDEDFESLHDAPRSHTRLDTVTHANSGDRGELRRRVRQDKFSSVHMESSRHVEEESSTGNIWGAAEVEASGQELPPSHAHNAASSTAEIMTHRTVPTPRPPDEETSDGIHICLVHFQRRTQITCSPDDTLAHLAEVHFAQELRDNARARFIYCGRLLDAEAPMRDHRLPPEVSIHIHFSSGGGTPPQATRADPAVLDISALFLPLLGIMLCAVWAVLLWKPVLFTILTKLMLYFLSFGYVLLLFARFGQRANVARL